MNMHNGKSFFKGFVFALLLVLSINLVMAATEQKTIEVITGDIKVFLDNRELSFNSTFDNRKFEPFVYNGEIYLPLHVITRGLGLNQHFDSVNNHILLGKPKLDIEKAKVKKWLNELKVIQGYMPSDSNFKNKNARVYDNTGNQHNIFISGFKSDITSFFLDKDFNHFQGVLVWRNGFQAYERGFKLKAFLDDQEVWTSKIMESGSLPQFVDLDLFLKDKLSFTLYSQEKKNGQYDETKWAVDKSDFRNKAVILVNPALY